MIFIFNPRPHAQFHMLASLHPVTGGYRSAIDFDVGATFNAAKALKQLLKYFENIYKYTFKFDKNNLS